MNSFLHGLIIDLMNRCDILLSEIQKVSEDDIKEKQEELGIRIEGIRSKLKELVPTLKSDAGKYSNKNIFVVFKEYSNRIQIIEYFWIPFIKWYSDENNKYFNRLLSQSCEQFGYPISFPFGSASGQEYYFSYPPEGIVVGPTLQAYSLLNLPDMSHEVAHILYLAYRDYYLEPFRIFSARYFNDKIAECKRSGASEEFIRLLSSIQAKWEHHWVVEFICDMIATYLIGEAYGWANLFLCVHTSSSSDVYEPDSSRFGAGVHPSDESRMRAIIFTLELIKPDLSLTELRNEWGDYVSILSPAIPDNYDFFYPEEVLRDLTQVAVKVCKDIGLKEFTSSVNSSYEPNIVKILNSAWENFRKNQETYVEWERETVRYIKSKIM